MAVLPATNLIPSLLTNAKVYRDGRDLLGVADVEMPDFEYMTESVAGLGIMGELDTPVVGHFQSMSLKIKWNVPTESSASLLRPEAHHLDIRGSIQKLDGGAGKIVNEPVKVVCRGLPKKSGIGKFEPGKKMEPETELELLYLKMWLNGSELLEIDKLNGIFSVQGEDGMADIRANLGMA